MMATTQAVARPAATARAVAPRHQASLDGIRAAAAGAVLLTHVGGMTGYTLSGTPLSWVLARGDVGVPIFFTLSGLLLYRRWAVAALTGEPAGQVPVYLWRRALRILPAYWIAVLIALPLLNTGPAQHLWSWIQYLLLIQIYDPHPWWSGTGATGLAQCWSLAVEVSFYLALPLLAAGLTRFARHSRLPRRSRYHREQSQARGDSVGRRARRLLAGIAVLGASSVGWTVLAYYPRPAWRFAGTLPPLMIWFCAGMAIAVVLAWAAADPAGPAVRFGRSVATSAGMCWLIAACAFAITCTPLAGPEFIGIPSAWGTEAKTVLYTLIAAAVVAPIAFQPLLPDQGAGLLSARLLGSWAGRFLGRISYGIFLWQFLVLYAFFYALHLKTVFEGVTYTAPEVMLIGVAITVLTIVAATVGYYLVEAPAQQFAHRRRAVPQPELSH